MAKLSTGYALPDLVVESRRGAERLRDRLEDGPLVVAFMRHFG